LSAPSARPSVRPPLLVLCVLLLSFLVTHLWLNTHCPLVGPEWNTYTNFRELSKPRVSTQTGAIITPMIVTKGIRKAHKEAEKERAEGGAAGKGAHGKGKPAPAGKGVKRKQGSK
jgi:hypothetical protein